MAPQVAGEALSTSPPCVEVRIALSLLVAVATVLLPRGSAALAAGSRVLAQLGPAGGGAACTILRFPEPWVVEARAPTTGSWASREHRDARLLGSEGWRGLLAPEGPEELPATGYYVLEGALSRETVQAMRDVIHGYEAKGCRRCRRGVLGSFAPWSYEVSNLAKDDALSGLLATVHDSANITAVLAAIFGGALGTAYVGAEHSDYGVNHVSSWHKDRLNGPYRLFEQLSPWSVDADGETAHIVKVVCYLQDHVADDDALTLVPGSHLQEFHPLFGNPITLHPRLGDVAIFDQRISHRGWSLLQVGRKLLAELFWHVPTGTSDRILVTAGFGRPNRFTQQFARGTKQRQEAWDDAECGFAAYSPCSAAKATACAQSGQWCL